MNFFINVDVSVTHMLHFNAVCVRGFHIMNLPLSFDPFYVPSVDNIIDRQETNHVTYT